MLGKTLKYYESALSGPKRTVLPEVIWYLKNSIYIYTDYDLDPSKTLFFEYYEFTQKTFWNFLDISPS